MNYDIFSRSKYCANNKSGDDIDFCRIDEFVAVKGATSSEFFDDRTLIVVDTSI